MIESGAYGQHLAAAMKVKSAASFVSGGSFRASKVAVTEIRHEAAEEHRTTPVPPEDGLLVMSQLRVWPRRVLWEDGKAKDAKPLAADAVTLFDLRKEWTGVRFDPVHYLCFYLPRQALIEIGAADDVLAADEFPNDYCAGNLDPTVSSLARALQPAFARPAEANHLFVDHIASAVCAHILRRYGGAAPAGRGGGSGRIARLSRRQQDRVQDAISENLDGDLTVAMLAGECGMAVTDFVRAFEETTGLQPHQWLLHRRVDRALDLLKNPRATLGSASAAAGFSSIAHFRRVLRQVNAQPPGALRRAAKQ